MLRAYVAFVLFIGIKSQFDPESHRNWKLLPHDNCGISGSYRIIGGSVTPMSAYPWIVRLGTTKKGIVQFSCGGVLVNSDTVLTAAHCLPTKNGTTLGPIRLGDHNIRTNPDCELGVCADPVIDVFPLGVIVPEQKATSLLHNDIAIVKLEEKVNFSASVWPICIGNKNFFAQDFAGRISEVAGWGYNNPESKQRSSKLEAVKLPVLSPELCREKYHLKFNLSYSQMCAGGEPGLDACNGDSGGPLMIVDDIDGAPRYYLLGIVSFGPVHCGNPDYPGIYTNLTTFIEWVFDNLDGAALNET